MRDLLAFLNANSGAFTVLFSAVVTLATVAYVVLTARMARETQALRRVETEPQLAVYLEPWRENIHVLELVIANIGRGPAYDVRLEADRDWLVASQVKLSSLGIFKHPIRYMAPGQAIRVFVGNSVTLHQGGH